MIIARLCLETTEQAVGFRSFRIAARPVMLDASMAPLAAFRLNQAQSSVDGARGRNEQEVFEASLIYHGTGLIGGVARGVSCWSSPTGFRLSIEDAGLFTITAGGARVTCLHVQGNIHSTAVVETILGPVLILALALQGTWCLHASAVRFGERTIAVAGLSGAGKSTLARYLGSQGGTHWRRLADDVLPLTIGTDGPLALPHFPQLKLPPDAQPSVGQPEQVPLDAVYLLQAPQDAARPDGVEIRPVAAGAGLLALVRHTIAARLFDRALLARHSAFCAQVATQIPIRRLSYPHDYALLPHIREAIEADVETF